MVFDLPDSRLVFEAREFLERELKKKTTPNTSLESYMCEDEKHTALQIELTRLYRENRFGPRIIQAQLPFFRDFLGPDLSVQSNPYLRITRPGKPQDNIGYHRDTFYGGSPYELSVLIPFVDIEPESALKILPGSHLAPQEAYPTEQVVSEEVTKGSAKHQLGFLYAPKLMRPGIEKEMVPIPLKVGQGLLFSLAAVHGSLINGGKVARWSSDIRVMPAFAPVDLSARPDYYEPLCRSPLTQAACEYFYGKERRESVELELCDAAPRK